MIGVKYKYLIFIPSFFIFFSVIFPIINLIKITLNFDPLKINNSKSLNYSYEILSSDNKILSKLSRKFDILNDKNSIPFFIKYSFISAEDKRFFHHNGIDLIGSSRALIRNIQSGYLKEGGSTITQQVARVIFLNNSLNFQRKFSEIIISLILDFKLSKNQILKLYLNNIYLGSGAYGVNEASQIYFGKFITELTLSEIALIAGLAPAPSIFSPYENIDLAIKKRNRVLESMYIEGYISLDEKNEALKEKVKLNYQESNKDLKDNLLINFILNETNSVIKNHNKHKFLRIKSSINKNWQEIGQQLARSFVPKNLETALVSIESNNGLIRTMITSKNPTLNEFNRVTSAVRPLGSTFKIIPYAAALIDGKNSSIFCSYPNPNKLARFIIFLRPISLAIFNGTILDEVLKDSIKDILPRYFPEKFFGQ